MYTRLKSFLSPGLSLLLLFSMEANGYVPDGDAVLIGKNDKHIQLAGHLFILQEETSRMSVLDVQKCGFRKVIQDPVNLGPSNIGIWLRFSVKSEVDNDWYLYLDAPFMKEIDLYKKEKDGKFIHHSLGSDRPFHERYVLARQMILPLDLEVGETAEYYLRVRSNSVLRIPMQISDTQSIFVNSQPGEVANGIYFGLLLALLIYNLFVYISIRERTYLFYVFYILSFACTIGYVRGYLLQFIVPDFPIANHSCYFSSLAFLFGVLFTNGFLNIDQNCPGQKKLGNVVVAISLICFCVAIAGFLRTSFLISWALCLLFLYFLIRAGTTALSNGFRPARFYLLGFGIFFAGLIIYILKDIDILPDNWFTDMSMQLGSALEAIILSFALANKLNIFKREKVESQLLALQQATVFSGQLIESQEAERKRVASELHDSIGQSLGMVKNKVLLLKKDAGKVPVTEKQIQDLETMVGETIQEVRNISYNLRPLHLDLLGLTQSIQSLLEDILESGLLKVHTDIGNIDNLLSKSNEINVFRIVQECFNNIIKHAQATDTWIKIADVERVITIMVEDNGVGVKSVGPNDRIQTGFGLIGMRERVNIMNGKFEMMENMPNGTIVSIKIPY